jgi:cobalamin biosynthesis protein CbiD
MATTGPAQPGSRPAWYRRLSPSLQRVAAASDRVSSLPLRSGPTLAEAVARLPAALRPLGQLGDVLGSLVPRGQRLEHGAR